MSEDCRRERCSHSLCDGHPAEHGWRWLDRNGHWRQLFGQALENHDAQLMFERSGMRFDMILGPDNCAVCNAPIVRGDVVLVRPHETNRFFVEFICAPCARNLILGEQ